VKKILCIGTIAVLAAVTATFALLYYNTLEDQMQMKFVRSRDQQWLVSGGKHAFDVTQRTFDVIGLLAYQEGIDKWMPVGGPKSSLYPVMVAKDIRTGISDEDYVIGVVSGGTATAYPLKVVARHQNVIDGTQDPPVNVYFGNGSRTAAAFSGAGKPATYFGCTGFLYKNVDLLYDYATESLFVPLTGAFAAGERLGERVEILPSAVLPLGEWRKLYPESRLMTDYTGLKALMYPRKDVLGEKMEFKTRLRRTGGDSYADEEPVVAVSQGWESAVVPFAAAREAGRREVPVEVAGKRYTAHFTEDFKGAWVTDEGGGLAPAERTTYRIYVSVRPEAKTAEVK
jgi:hypothetical protein